MNCGCGELNVRHKSTDITLDDVQAAANGQSQPLEETADHIHEAARRVRTERRQHHAR
jgi:hypothetical protein